MLTFQYLHPRAHDLLGYIPQFLSLDDPRCTKEQLNENYGHGGGWRPMEGWTLNPVNHLLKYPGDPAMAPVAIAQLRQEVVIMYPHAWVVILQQDGSFEIARLD